MPAFCFLFPTHKCTHRFASMHPQWVEEHALKRQRTHTEREQWLRPAAENKQTGRCLKALKMRAACKLFFWQYPSLLTHRSATTEIPRQAEKDEGRMASTVAITELIGEGLIKSVYIPRWAPFCQRDFQLHGTYSEEFLYQNGCL